MDKEIKIIIVIVFHMLKKLEARLNMISRDIKCYTDKIDRMHDKEANFMVSSLPEKITKLEKIGRAHV